MTARASQVEERDRRKTRGLSTESRFWFYVMPEPNSGCWLWTGTMDDKGYGKLWNGTRGMLAHQYGYSLFRGPVPLGLVLDHKCRVRCCVNPDHLRAVTQRINARENSIGHAAVNAAKTRCSKGHEFTPENTILRARGWRGCRQCKLMSNARFRRKIYKTVRVFKNRRPAEAFSER